MHKCNAYSCKHCSKCVKAGGATRLKEHIMDCKQAPPEAKRDARSSIQKLQNERNNKRGRIEENEGQGRSVRQLTIGESTSSAAAQELNDAWTAFIVESGISFNTLSNTCLIERITRASTAAIMAGTSIRPSRKSASGAGLNALYVRVKDRVVSALLDLVRSYGPLTLCADYGSDVNLCPSLAITVGNSDTTFFWRMYPTNDQTKSAELSSQLILQSISELEADLKMQDVVIAICTDGGSNLVSARKTIAATKKVAFEFGCGLHACNQMISSICGDDDSWIGSRLHEVHAYVDLLRRGKLKQLFKAKAAELGRGRQLIESGATRFGTRIAELERFFG